MLIRRTPDIRPSEITEESVYINRREFMRIAGLAVSAGVLATACDAQGDAMATTSSAMGNLVKSPLSTDESPNSWEDITTYNNYYEFGTGKDDPYQNAQEFKTRPWEVTIAGECDKPGTLALDDLIAPHALEERIYRLRCVEAWSMVIPWVGIPLADLLKRFQPNSRAKYVRFETLLDPKQMPGQKRRVLYWPYVEGLRIDEAMNPLTIMALGVYGKQLPNQNGAPMRLVVPWKYGFKSIKSIVKIEFVEHQPDTSWELAAANEYGFYANVNPLVDHPRWSQASHRVIGAGIFAPREPTRMFNGYADQVASLYTGLDLTRYY